MWSYEIVYTPPESPYRVQRMTPNVNGWFNTFEKAADDAKYIYGDVEIISIRFVRKEDGE